MPLSLVRHAIRRRPVPRLLPLPPTRRKSYDVVIVGGGGHGLATAYYLQKNHGINNVAVFEKSWLAGGNTARNTAIIRSNYLSETAINFYKLSMQLFSNLSHELDFNIMYSERGHLTLAHSDSACRASRWRVNMNRHLGVDSEYVDRNQIAKICPQLNLSHTVRHPIMGALYHPTGAIARHDAVAWGYAIRAAANGVSIYPQTEVVKVLQENGKATGVQLADGEEISAGAVLQATAGASSQVAAMAGFKLPITSVPLQAMVSQPLAPFLDPIIVSGSLHVYVSQSARGELVMGGAVDSRPLHATRSTALFKEGYPRTCWNYFRFWAASNYCDSGAGIADMTPDFSPIMGETPLANYYIDAGWGTWGFKATPVCGVTMAETIASGKAAEMITPYALSRFWEMDLVGEKGAAAVGH